MIRRAVAVSRTGRAPFVDFIERLFGIAPDGGSGSVASLVFAVPVLVAGMVVGRRAHSRRTVGRHRRNRR